MSDISGSTPPPRGLLRAPNDLLAGLLLLLCAWLAWWFGRDLSVGTAFRMGPGYIPRLLTWFVFGFGQPALLHQPRWARRPARHA
jgi:hypothetical protein